MRTQSILIAFMKVIFLQIYRLKDLETEINNILNASNLKHENIVEDTCRVLTINSKCAKLYFESIRFYLAINRHSKFAWELQVRRIVKCRIIFHELEFLGKSAN